MNILKICCLVFILLLSSSAIFSQAGKTSSVDIFLKKKKSEVKTNTDSSQKPIEKVEPKTIAVEKTAETFSCNSLPNLRGIRLESSREQVSNLFPEVKLRFFPEKVGFKAIDGFVEVDLSLYNAKNMFDILENPPTLGGKVNLHNVRSMQFAFLDDNLKHIRFSYLQAPFENERLFRSSTAKGLGIPESCFGEKIFCLCGKYTITAKWDGSWSSSVEISDKSVDAIVQQRRREHNKRVSEGFKP